MCEYMNFFIQGAPNPKDLGGVEENQLLEKEILQRELNNMNKNMTLSIKPY